MDSDDQRDMEELRRNAAADRKTIERLREQARVLMGRLEKPNGESAEADKNQKNRN